MRPLIVLYVFQLDDVGRTTAASTVKTLTTIRDTSSWTSAFAGTAFIVVGMKPPHHNRKKEEEEEEGKGKERAEYEENEIMETIPQAGLKRFDWIEGKLLRKKPKRSEKPRRPRKEVDSELAPIIEGEDGGLELGDEDTDRNKEVRDVENNENFEELGINPDNEASTTVLRWMRRCSENVKWHGYAQVDWDPETSLISQPKQLLSLMVRKSCAEQTLYDDDIVKTRLDQRQYRSLWFLLLHIIEAILCVLLLPVIYFMTVSVTLVSLWLGLVMIGIPRILFRSTKPIALRPLMFVWAFFTVSAASLGILILAIAGIIALVALIPMAMRLGYLYGMWGMTTRTVDYWIEFCNDSAVCLSDSWCT